MFTGLIEQTGEIESLTQTAAGRELRIRAPFTDLADGESIAVNGACLTVNRFGDGWFEVAAIETTLTRTTIAEWKIGRKVNLERAMKLGDRLGGHIVQGHVDCVGKVLRRATQGDAVLIDVTIPTAFETLLVLHGSIAIDGVSLTLNDLIPGGLQLSLIDYTLRHTNLGDLAPGTRVHVETDVIAKHVKRLLDPYLRDASTLSLPIDFSLEH